MEDNLYELSQEMGSVDQSVVGGINDEHTRNMTMNIT